MWCQRIRVDGVPKMYIDTWAFNTTSVRGGPTTPAMGSSHSIGIIANVWKNSHKVDGSKHFAENQGLVDEVFLEQLKIYKVVEFEMTRDGYDIVVRHKDTKTQIVYMAAARVMILKAAKIAFGHQATHSVIDDAHPEAFTPHLLRSRVKLLMLR